MHIKGLAGGVLGLFLISCGEQNTTVTQETIFSGDSVTIKSDSPILSKIKLATIAEEPFSAEFRTVGTVQAETGKFAEVFVPYDGRVTSAAVRLGDKVRAGQALFSMSSSDFAEISKAYFQAVRANDLAQAEYKRKQTLFNHGIVAQRELDEAKVEAENAQHEKASAEATLRIYNVNPSNLKMGQHMTVSSPISGEVVASNITPGQLVKADDDVIVTVADLSSVWVTAQIKEHYLGSVTMGGKAEVFMDADPNQIIQGNVFNIGNMVDEETRSVQVILSCNNENRALKHGQFVSVHFIAEPKPAIVIPSTAVFQGEQHSYVFVATNKANTYVRRKVEVGSSNDDNNRVSIISGLKNGEKIIAEGGLYLND